jgi:serine/threonine-protein kinase
MTNETSYDTLFGKMAVEQGLCTNDEFTNSLKELQVRRKVTPVGLINLMVELGYVTGTQAERLKKSIKESKTAAHQIPGYQILGKLGAGAMAIVYKAKQLSLNRTVAIKVLPKRFTENPEYVERFYKEGRAAGKLNHNNIVQAIDVGEAGGYHFFVMEYVEGKTIHEDIASGKVYDENEAIDIIIQVAHALQHAHNLGLIHRDVKPKNIMINRAGIVKLADMGLARETTDIETAKTEKGRAYGTPYYIAPEQIRGEIDIDCRADIYGLGATLYHMLTGRVPFMAEDPSDVMRKHLKEQLIPPDHINTRLSTGISEVIEVMMAKDKQERYNNIDELLKDLQAVREGRPPMRAHKRFDVSMLEQIEEAAVDKAEMKQSKEKAAEQYKILSVVFGIAAVVLLLIVIVLSIQLLQ